MKSKYPGILQALQYLQPGQMKAVNTDSGIVTLKKGQTTDTQPTLFNPYSPQKKAKAIVGSVRG